MMIGTQALVSLYIKDGKEKMINYVESSFAKKKGKRNSHQEEGIEMNPSIYNFLTVKSFKHTFDYFSQEMLNSLEGKTRSSSMFKDQEDLDIKDINSFKILYNKYLIAPSTSHSTREQHLLSKNVEIKAGERIFKNELENSEINESLEKLGKAIEQSKLHMRQSSIGLFKKLQFDIMAGRTSINHYEYCHQLRQSLQTTSISVLRINPSLIQESAESDNICKQNIVLTIRRWLNELLQALNIKDLMNSPTIMVEWGNSLLLAEKQQLFAQQISGKVLFNIEQSIAKLKEATSPHDYATQFHLRQKKYGVTNHNPSNFPLITPKQKGKTEKVSLLAFAEKQGTKGSNNTEEQYNKMTNRINNLKRLKSPENNIEQVRPKSKGQDMSHNRLEGKFFNQYAGIRKKLTPLKQDNMGKFQYNKFSKSNPSSQLPNRIVYKNQKASPNLPRTKLEIKFPIKIGHFEIYSPNESCLCFQVEEINLKELPLVFIKNRLKFGENKVKIEYPCKPKPNVTELVCKCLQILNSLGAIVSCEEQSSYKAIHDIDSSEILAVSWLVERPVREIVKLYGEYFSSCPTKK